MRFCPLEVQRSRMLTERRRSIRIRLPSTGLAVDIVDADASTATARIGAGDGLAGVEGFALGGGVKFGVLLGEKPLRAARSAVGWHFGFSAFGAAEISTTTLRLSPARFTRSPAAARAKVFPREAYSLKPHTTATATA